MAGVGLRAVTSRTITTEEQRQAVLAALKGLSLGKKGWDIEWKQHIEKRSTTANAFYWVVVGLIADDTGNSRDDTHEALKNKFCPMKVVRLMDDGEIFPIYSTAAMRAPDFAGYLEKVIAFATDDLGLILPARPDQEGAYG